MNTGNLIEPQIPSVIFAKDLNHKLIYCNERYAEVSGMDSPAQCIGKDDHRLIWKNQAHIYIKGDLDVFKGGIQVNAVEPQQQINKMATILINKSQLKNEKDELIGVVGSYIDITDVHILRKQGHYDHEHKRFYLGEKFGKEYFTHCELEVFKHVLHGKTSAEISHQFNKSPKTIESQIKNIKRKLQCQTKGDIITTSISSGLYHIIL